MLNCNESFYSKKFYESRLKGETNSDSYLNFIQSFVNGLGCENKEVVCIDDASKNCDTSASYNCNLFIANIITKSTDKGLTIDLSAEVINGVGALTYLWKWNTTKLKTRLGSQATDPILKLEWIGQKEDSFDIELIVTDSLGCNDTDKREVGTCFPCDNTQFSATFIDEHNSEDVPNFCSNKREILIGENTYYEAELDVTFTCDGEPNEDDLVETYLKVDNVIYPNGFVYEQDKYKLRIKVGDENIVITKDLVLFIKYRSCKEMKEISFTIPKNTLDCCFNCEDLEHNIEYLNNTNCINETTFSGENVFKFDFNIDLLCEGSGYNQYIVKSEILTGFTYGGFKQLVKNSGNSYTLYVESLTYSQFKTSAPKIVLTLKRGTDSCNETTYEVPFDTDEYEVCCTECDGSKQVDLTLTNGGCFNSNDETSLNLALTCGTENINSKITNVEVISNLEGVSLVAQLDNGVLKLTTNDYEKLYQQLCLKEKEGEAIDCKYYAYNENHDILEFDPDTLATTLFNSVTTGMALDTNGNSFTVTGRTPVVANAMNFVYSIVRDSGTGIFYVRQVSSIGVIKYYPITGTMSSDILGIGANGTDIYVITSTAIHKLTQNINNYNATLVRSLGLTNPSPQGDILFDSQGSQLGQQLFYTYVDDNNDVILEALELNNNPPLVLYSVQLSAYVPTEKPGASIHMHDNLLYVQQTNAGTAWKFGTYQISGDFESNISIGNTTNLKVLDTSSNYRECINSQEGGGPIFFDYQASLRITYDDCGLKTIDKSLSQIYCLEKCCEPCSPVQYTFDTTGECVGKYINQDGVEFRKISGNLVLTCSGDASFSSTVTDVKMRINGVDYPMTQAGLKWEVSGLPASDTTFNSICNLSKSLIVTATQCNGPFQYTLPNVDTSWCDKICDDTPCIECGTQDSEVNVINPSLSETSCWFTRPDGKKEMRLYPSITCNQTTYYTNLDVTIVGQPTGCTFSIRKENGEFFLVNESNCQAIVGNITLRICWNKCN